MVRRREENSGGDVYVDGASNILTKPDFVDIERMRELFRTFDYRAHARLTVRFAEGVIYTRVLEAAAHARPQWGTLRTGACTPPSPRVGRTSRAELRVAHALH